VGPCVLQDFSLFQVLRFGFPPSKVAFLTWHAQHDAEHGDWPSGYPLNERPSYSLSEIRHWLQVLRSAFTRSPARQLRRRELRAVGCTAVATRGSVWAS
jgi:hypothetical protein